MSESTKDIRFLNKAMNIILDAACGVIALMCYLALMYAASYGLFYAGLPSFTYEGLYSVSFTGATILLFIGYLIFVRRKPALQIINVKRPGIAQVLSSIVIGLGLLGLVTLFIMFITYLGELGVGDASEQIEEYSESMVSYADAQITVPFWDKLLLFIGSAFLVPLAEEIVFRGVIFSLFRRHMHTAAAVFISALMFGVAHGISIHITYAFVCGVLLAITYHYTSSIWAAYIVHMIFNLFGGALMDFLTAFPSVTDDILDSVYGFCFDAEVLMIGPAIGAVFILYRLYRYGTLVDKKEETVAISEQA